MRTYDCRAAPQDDEDSNRRGVFCTGQCKEPAGYGEPKPCNRGGVYHEALSGADACYGGDCPCIFYCDAVQPGTGECVCRGDPVQGRNGSDDIGGGVMAIVVNLDVVMAKKKTGVTELAKEIDIKMANLSILKNNKAKAVRFTTLDALCKALDCQPGDILEYVPDE